MSKDGLGGSGYVGDDRHYYHCKYDREDKVMKKPVKPTPVTQRIKITSSEEISHNLNGTPAEVIEYLKQFDMPGYRIEFCESWDSGEVRLYREEVELYEEYQVRLKKYAIAMKKYEENLRSWKIEKAKETLKKLQEDSNE